MTRMGGPYARVLVAPDRFKGSLAASAAAQHIATGFRRGAPGVAVDELAVADGGDGTIDAVTRSGFTTESVKVAGPDGEPTRARVARLGDVAVVEIAETSGLAQMDGQDLDPVHASSYGLGEAILAATNQGCQEIVVGLGGSATTDGGAGLLQALGARLTDRRGREIDRGGIGLRDLARVDLEPARRRLAGVRLVAASDVTNPLLGAQGAAKVFGPRKGATPAEVDDLRRGLANLAMAVEGTESGALAQRPGAGAAGGVGFALFALGGELRPGADMILDMVGIADHVAGADLVITGEGSLGTKSLHGKATRGVIAAATRAGVPVVAVVGRNLLTLRQANRCGINGIRSLAELEPDLARSLVDAGALLHEMGRRVASDWMGSRGFHSRAALPNWASGLA